MHVGLDEAPEESNPLQVLAQMLRERSMDYFGPEHISEIQQPHEAGPAQSTEDLGDADLPALSRHVALQNGFLRDLIDDEEDQAQNDEQEIEGSRGP